MRRLLSLITSRLRLWLRDEPDADTGVEPRYGSSVGYVACSNCGEGSFVYDEEAGVSVCNVCGTTDEESSE